jgi:Periplasmic component of the Tol biopolymer transport system
MQKTFAPIVCFFLITCFGLFTHAQLEVPPQLEWKTLNTAHFQVIYNAEHQDLGVLYGSKLELAFEKLRPYFTQMPARTVVVINDKTDLTNGYATRIPYPHIVAYPVLPGPEDSLSDPGDWAFELLAHEFTHILSFEPAEGIMKALRYGFGTIVAPNLLLPRWWKEGLAVEMETKLGNHGRLRSIFQDSALRAWVEAGTLTKYDIAQANEAIPSWPDGTRPYIFGSVFWSEAYAKKGDKIGDELTLRHSSRVPYFIEAPAKATLMHDYETEYQNSLVSVQTRAQAQLVKLREVEPTTYILPKNGFLYLTAPAISPDGQHMALITENDSYSRAVKLLSRKKGDESFLDLTNSSTVDRYDDNIGPSFTPDEPTTGRVQRVSWYPGSDKIIYDKIDLANRYEVYSDLYVYDLKTKKVKALTKRLRAREPAVSPNGHDVAFVKLEGSKTSLGLLKITDHGQSVEILVNPGLQERISYPEFLDEKTLVFSWRKETGEEFLYRYNIETNSAEKILPEFPNARFAHKTSQGLMFTSSKNGTHNIYLANADLTAAKPLTHTLTAHFGSDFDSRKNEIYSGMMTAQGPKIIAITQDNWSKTPEELPVIDKLFADRYPAQEKTTAGEPLLAESKYQVEDYSPYGYLWPRYWIPFIAGSSSETGLVISAQTSAFDPLKKHSYSLMGSWDTGLNRGSVEGSYMNQTTRLPWMLFASQRSSYLGNINNKYTDSTASLSVLPDVYALSKYATLQLGWTDFKRDADFTANPLKRTGPFAILSYADISQSGAQVSPESSGGGYLGTYYYVAKEDSVQHTQLIAGGVGYLSKYLPRHHAIMMRVNGLYTPEKVSVYFGASTNSLMFTPDSYLPLYVLRGYKTGQLFGRNLVTTNVEYRFPIMNLYKGWGTDPWYFRRLTGAVVADGGTADGFFLNEAENRYESVTTLRQFWSVGGELKLETTIGYTFPVTFVLGYYRALSVDDSEANSIGTTIQISGL